MLLAIKNSLSGNRPGLCIRINMPDAKNNSPRIKLTPTYTTVSLKKEKSILASNVEKAEKKQVNAYDLSFFSSMALIIRLENTE